MSDLVKLLRENSGDIIWLLCVIASVLYCFMCKRWGRNRAQRPPSLTWLASAADIGLPRDFGLGQMAIDALPTLAYDGGSKEDGEMTACAICLSDVKKGEMLRVLPYCKHGFHIECIDMWLHSHSLCPLCRAKAKPPAPAAAL